MRRIICSRFFFYSVLILLRVGLEFSYVELIHPVYGSSYLDFDLDVSFFAYVISWVVYLSSLFFVRHRLYSVSDFASLTIVTSVLAPLSVLVGLDGSRSLLPLFVSIIPLVIIWCVCDVGVLKSVSFPHFKNSEIFIVGVSWVCIIYLAVWYFISGAATNLNLDFTKVYDFRAKNAGLIDVGLLSYLNIWTYKIFIIFLVCFYLRRKKYAFVVVLGLIQLFFFSVNGHKAALFFPVIVFGLWFYFRKSNLAVFVPLFLTAIVYIGVFLYVAFDFQYAASMLVRRIFFVPAGLTFEYFSLAQMDGHIYWSNSVLSFFGGYPYDLPLSFVIGERLLTAEMGANNGFVSTGYVHAGVWGVAFYGLVFAYLLRVIDGATETGVPLWLALSLTVVPIRAMIISSDLFTVILTHGLFISVVVIIMIRTRVKRES